MTQAAAPQQGFSYLGKVYCAASGQWAFRLFRDGEEIAGGAGFDDECEAGDACAAQLPGLDFPIRLVADPEFVEIHQKSVVELEREIGDLRHALLMARQMVARELPLVLRVGAGIKNPVCLVSTFANLSSAILIIERALK